MAENWKKAHPRVKTQDFLKLLIARLIDWRHLSRSGSIDYPTTLTRSTVLYAFANSFPFSSLSTAEACLFRAIIE